MSVPIASPAPRVCAVSFLNTVPLVWGLLHGRQRGLFDLSFCVPSECADRLAAGASDVGIVPAIEAVRLGLEPLPGAGIACRGAVRSILLISKVPFESIHTLATDSGSRTSAALARILLARRYGATPRFVRHPPALDQMLATADAALVIGDPALRIDPASLPFRTLDLGAEWLEFTGLPMVFAYWAARPGCVFPGLAEAFVDSMRFGTRNLEEIIVREARERAFDVALVRNYFARNVIFEIGELERQGLQRFLDLAREFGILEASGA
ncbi:MAG: menaquinone biosynthesis protein [Acidobacteria bacterium]|nr:menaquinone biosynthesis protein [Acidobacteriota bacterium]